MKNLTLTHSFAPRVSGERSFLRWVRFRVWIVCAWLAAGEPVIQANWRPTEQFLQAVRHVESSHGRFVYGDDGRSLGDFHMSEAAWIDVNVFRKARGLKTYSYDGFVLNPKINRAYAADYLTILYHELKKSLKRPPTPAEIYAAYNMGLGAFAACGFKLTRVNPITARKCQQIRQLMQSSEAKK